MKPGGTRAARMGLQGVEGDPEEARKESVIKTEKESQQKNFLAGLEGAGSLE